MLNIDILCQAKSGLGKTAIFVLTTLHQLEPVPGECQVLVMCHTRELAYQIKNEYARFSKYLPDAKTAVFYGGTPMAKDVELLKNKDQYPNIIVATPGRLNALVRDKALSLRNIKSFVLDECDKMLDQIGSPYFPTLAEDSLIPIRRHAPRRAGNLQSNTRRQTSHDVQCNIVTGSLAYLQEVHAQSHRVSFPERHQAYPSRPPAIFHSA
jgi:hypothetical protein